MQSKEYKQVEFMTLLPVILGFVLGTALLALAREQIEIKPYAACLGMSAVFFVGGFILSLMFAKKRFRVLQSIIGQNANIKFVSEDLNLRMDYSQIVNVLISTKVATVLLEQLMLASELKNFSEFYKRLKRLPQITVNLQVDEPVFSYGGITKPVQGLTQGLECTVRVQSTPESTVGLICHEVSHAILQAVIRVQDTNMHHKLTRKMMADPMYHAWLDKLIIQGKQGGGVQ